MPAQTLRDARREIAATEQDYQTHGHTAVSMEQP